MDRLIVPVLMCGGAGTRLWPISRESMPKQFVPLVGQKSTFHQTIERISGSNLFARPIVITNSEFRFIVAEQLRECAVEADIVLEPARRDNRPKKVLYSKYVLVASNLHPVARLSANSAQDDIGERSTLHRYAVPLVGMSAATIVGLALRNTQAGHSAIAIAYLVPALASAWWGGYGPGVLACLLGLLGAPYFFSPGFNVLHVDLTRAALVLLVSVLISRVAEGRRKIEEALRHANEHLDSRVRAASVDGQSLRLLHIRRGHA